MVTTSNADSCCCVALTTPSAMGPASAFAETLMRTAFILILICGLHSAAQTPAQGSRYRGRVVDATTRRPLAGAEVFVAPGVFARTDASGRFAVEAPGPGQHEISASIRG